ncbi:MAG: M28 family peptidase [Clostridia bacterium]|nr:M28 family peptidase [Clostridia bacterium]
MLKKIMAAILLSLTLYISLYSKAENIDTKLRPSPSSSTHTNYIDIDSLKNFDIKNFDIRDVVEKFSSAEFTGRLVCSEGNKKAALLLSSIFNEIPLQACNGNSYFMEYNEVIPESIRQKLNLSDEIIAASNVVGKIQGKSSNKALVLSAHFDHIGFQEDTLYPGALDNCSGLAVLLDLAKKLSAHSLKNPTEYDILICAFNSEEYGLQGSKAFVKEINGTYENIYNINLEYMGLKQNKNLIILGDPLISNSLCYDVYRYLRAKNFSCNILWDSYISDHLSFNQESISSITIGQKPSSEYHSIGDTADKLDYEFLDNVSKALFDFIITHGNLNFE